MKKRIHYMENLINCLNDLMQVCGINKDEKLVPYTPTLPQHLLDMVFHDYAMCDFLEKITNQIENVTNKVKERNIDIWNSKEDKEQLSETYQTIDKQKAELESLTKELNSANSQLTLIKKKLNSIDKQLTVTENQRDSAKKNLEDEILQKNRQQYEWIQNMIEMQDNLRQREDFLEMLPENERILADKLIRSQMLETENFLGKAGVEIIDAQGEFNNQIQMVIGTKPTDNPELIYHIDQTSRPGYRIGNEIIRLQEVIVFVKEGK